MNLRFVHLLSALLFVGVSTVTRAQLTAPEAPAENLPPLEDIAPPAPIEKLSIEARGFQLNNHNRGLTTEDDGRRRRFRRGGDSIPDAPSDAAQRAVRREKVYNRLNAQHRLSLELTDAATMTSSRTPSSIVLDQELKSEVVKTYTDPYSGFQAYKIRTMKFGRATYTYAFSSTQLYERDDSQPSGTRSLVDSRDWVTNASFGLPQMESLAATELMNDVRADLAAGKQVTMSGQSLGGMLSHSLGYMVLRSLRESGNLSQRENLTITSWGIPGVTDLIRDYMKKRLGVDEQLDPALTSETFEAVFYETDLLPTVGQHFGKIVVIDGEVLTPDENESYFMNVPGVRRRLESHLYPGFDRALRRQGINYENGVMVCPVERGFRLSEPLQNFSRYLSRLYLDGRYKRALEENGTDADWQLCYASPKWLTNMNDNCTARTQRGCEVRNREASRADNRGKAKWCMPEVNPLSNARFRAERER